MIKYKFIFISLFIGFSSIGLFAQESLRGLSVNPELIKKSNVKTTRYTLKSAQSSTLNLPFSDDFSYDSDYPDITLWSDQTVAINSKYSIGPPTKGVATFNALNKNGIRYDSAYNRPFYADTLTSLPINLENATGVYLSFFYQPQGGGAVAPSTGDSLKLEFYNPDKPDYTGWHRVWAVPGSTMQPFKEILIQVDPVYLKQGFRFRFRNIASIDSADSARINKIDFWHIDNVRLDKNRNAGDSLVLYINLPFVDDFSSGTVYPDQKRWADMSAYINFTLPVDPPSVGVATLDAVDENGLIYSRASTAPFVADYLTSKPFNLAIKDTIDTTIYFSFYYQPQGIGDRPETNDSLILDFYNTELADSIAWRKVWAAPGDSVYAFKQAIVQVTAEYQHKGFAFRFRNKASLSAETDLPGRHGNVDQWHVDYVLLDRGRSPKDTIIDDVAFVKPMTSLLQTYQAMPWEHFILAFRQEIKPKVRLTYRNNNISERQVSRSLEAKDLYSQQVVALIDMGSEKIGPGVIQNPEPDLTNPFTSTSTDSALFEIKSFLDTKNDFNKWNDTIKFLQVFNNYFALDDGSPETGYGLSGQGSQNAMVAYAFTAYQPDTLTAISIFFNPTENNITTTEKYYFKLAVWADNKEKPGRLIYVESNDNYKPIKLNQFYPYKLDTALLVNGRFYVGWIQTSENYLNIGFDLNNNNQSKHFVNLDGTWRNTQFKGSLMIRPILRTKKIVVSNGPTITTEKHEIRIYPNPAEKYVTIETGDILCTGNCLATVFNVSGKQVLQASLRDNTLDVSSLPNGIYIIKISGAKANLQPVKLLIQR